ncbi:MAG: hypothetical protein K1060chlam1_00575 [Candidatus Anoxychlamydiales bacterium]|nr:hypothetical protein [Candidatus Anoxychlamydiales bacterium]
MLSLSCPTRTFYRSAMIALPIGVISSIGEIAAISNGFDSGEVLSKTAILTTTVSFIAGFVFSSMLLAREKENIDQCVNSPDSDLEKDDKENRVSSFLKNKTMICIGESIYTGAITALIATSISALFGYRYFNS